MRYELTLSKGSDIGHVYYESSTNTMVDYDGNDFTHLLALPKEPDWVNLRIVLGNKCNMNCKYCLPKNMGRDECAGERLEPAVLAAEIGRVLNGRRIGGVLFFGGEPFMYFEEMKELHRLLKPYCYENTNTGNFYVTSNGVMLSEKKIVDWIIDEGINAGISWDGPASKPSRGRDIMDKKGVKEALKRIMHEAWTQLTLMAVATKYNPSVSGYLDYACKVLEEPVIPVYENSPLTVVNERSEALAIPLDQLERTCTETMHTLIFDERIASRSTHAWRFCQNLGKQEVLKTRFCHYMYDTDLNLDMTGAILFCKNAPKDACDPRTGLPYLLGNIKDLPSDLPTYPWAGDALLRPENADRIKSCHNCLIKNNCAGGCLLAPEKYAQYNCAAAFYEGVAQIGNLLYRSLDGCLLEKVEAISDELAS